MTDKIEPALTPEEWAKSRIEWTANGRAYAVQSQAEYGPELFIGEPKIADACSRPASILALANDALPDCDPRKITHEQIATLRDAARPH